MLAVLSPAKKLHEGPPLPAFPLTEPQLLEQTGELIELTRSLSSEQLQDLMGISQKLGDLNHQRFQDFQGQPDPERTRQAIHLFAGDTYRGLDAASLSGEELDFAQEHLAILSGLYGILRPLDRIQPYRLEMGTKLANEAGRNLYAFWGQQLADKVNEWTAAHPHRVLINLASTEYFKAIAPKALELPVITPVFQEERAGKARTLGMFAKVARGSMARAMIQNRWVEPEQLKEFTGGGYRYVEDASTPSRWVFRRPQP